MTPIKRDGGSRLSVCNVFPFWTTHYAFYIAFALTRREGPSSWKSRKWSLLLQSLLVIIIVISRVTAPRVGQSERWSLYAMNLPLAVQRVEPLLMTVQNYFLNNVVKKSQVEERAAAQKEELKICLWCRLLMPAADPHRKQGKAGIHFPWKCTEPKRNSTLLTTYLPIGGMKVGTCYLPDWNEACPRITLRASARYVLRYYGVCGTILYWQILTIFPRKTLR